MKTCTVIGRTATFSFRAGWIGLLVLAAFLFGAAPVMAQTPAPLTPPPGPRVTPVPDFARWVVTFTYPEDRASKQGQPVTMPPYANTRTRTIVTTKTGNFVHEELIDMQGSKFELWHIGGVQYAKADTSKIWQQTEAGTNSNGARDAGFSPLPASGYRDLDWIDGATFAGITMYDAKSCYVYIEGAPANLDLSNPSTLLTKLDNVSKVAFIEAKSGLPVEVRDGEVYHDYEFADAPDTRLKLPDDLASQIKKGNEARAALYQQAPRPY